MGPMDRVTGLEPHHRGPAPLSKGGPGLGRSQRPGPDRARQRRNHSLDGTGHRPGRGPQHPSHPRMLRIAGAIDQLSLGLAVTLEHLGDLQHPHQRALVIPQPQTTSIDPDPIRKAKTHRDRPQRAIRQPHLFGHRRMLLSPHKPRQRAISTRSQRAQIGRLSPRQHQRRQPTGPQRPHLAGVKTPIHQLPTMRHTTTRPGQPLVTDRHGASSSGCQGLQRVFTRAGEPRS
jgi:hypothetical protein